MVPALVQTSVTIGFAILLTAGLRFVGAGVVPDPRMGLDDLARAPPAHPRRMVALGVSRLAMTVTVFGYAAIARAFEDGFADPWPHPAT